ncbi:molybdate ABC transporter substrate-binding protein [Tritonibacter aquimaris]|nr:molybdate ABC transporter substrate-binding protein [Tritonibacter aquimaris]
MIKRLAVSFFAHLRLMLGAAIYMLWGCIGASLPSHAGAEPVTVFAASSLKPVLDELAPHYETKTGNPLILSYAGSALIARQIQLGAPADVFISANQSWMDHLAAQGAIDPNSRFDLVRNRLALVAAKTLETGSRDLRRVLATQKQQKIAMGLVHAVPAGQYGKEALEALGLWHELAPHVVQLDNVRAAVRLVARGELGLGIVYASDAHKNPDIDLVGLFPENTHSPILYPAAAVTGSEQAEQVLTFLRSETARAALRHHGFVPLFTEEQ